MASWASPEAAAAAVWTIMPASAAVAAVDNDDADERKATRTRWPRRPGVRGEATRTTTKWSEPLRYDHR